MGVMAMGSSPMVPQRVEQSQLLVQHPDAPSPAQPQVLTELTKLLVQMAPVPTFKRSVHAVVPVNCMTDLCEAISTIFLSCVRK